MVDARGAITNYTYNVGTGQVIDISYVSPNANIPVTPSVYYAYNNLGMRTQMVDGLGYTDYVYNNLGQMTSETRKFNDVLPNAPQANNSFKLEYSYTLNGQMKSLKDPFEKQVNYDFDKIGRLNAVTGNTISNISNYASTPSYNARGVLTHLNYGNGVETNITNFNNKLQATNFELKKGTTELIKKNYQFYDDGGLKYSQDFKDARFDRLYKYDFASRIMEAKTGAEARGGTVPTIDQEAQLPYRQSYNYNVYNQLTQRNNRHWGVEYWYQQSNNLSYTYQNNRITNSGYAYDADGRSLNSMEGNGSNSYYDSSGSMNRVVSWSESDIYRYNDGNGRESKRKTIRWITDEYGSEYWSTTPEFKYYIRSSLFGNEVVTQVDKTGRKEKTIIRAAGSELAVNGVYYYGTTNTQSEHLFFKHSDPSGASIRVTDPTGIESGGDGTENAPAELDAFGGNVGFYSPYIVLQTFPDPETQNWDYLYNESPMYVNGHQVRATIDGMAVPLSMALNRLQNGSAIPAALAGYQGRNGFSFEYLGVGLFQTNIPDAYRTYTNTKPNPPFYVPHGQGADGQLVSTGGIYLSSWSAGSALAGEKVGKQSNETIPLTDSDIASLRNDLEQLFNETRCADFLTDLTLFLQQNALARKTSKDINFLDFFDDYFSRPFNVKVRASTNLGGAYVVENDSRFDSKGNKLPDIRSFVLNNSLPRQPFTGDFLYDKSERYVNTRGLIIIHELLHVYIGGDSANHRIFAEAAGLVATLSGDKFDLSNPLPKRSDYDSEKAFSGANVAYFDSILKQACSLFNRPL